MGDKPRTFCLQRDVDVSGVSGTGTVAWGAEWPDGTAVVRWATKRSSTVVWPRIDDVMAIHGHDGAARVVWLDQEANRERADLADRVEDLEERLHEAREDASSHSARVVQLELALEDAGIQVPDDLPFRQDMDGTTKWVMMPRAHIDGIREGIADARRHCEAAIEQARSPQEVALAQRVLASLPTTGGES